MTKTHTMQRNGRSYTITTPEHAGAAYKIRIDGTRIMASVKQTPALVTYQISAGRISDTATSLNVALNLAADYLHTEATAYGM